MRVLFIWGIGAGTVRHGRAGGRIRKGLRRMLLGDIGKKSGRRCMAVSPIYRGSPPRHIGTARREVMDIRCFIISRFGGPTVMMIITEDGAIHRERIGSPFVAGDPHHFPMFRSHRAVKKVYAMNPVGRLIAWIVFRRIWHPSGRCDKIIRGIHETRSSSSDG